MKKLALSLYFIITLATALPVSIMAMEVISNAELDGTAGQAGFTIGFGSTDTYATSVSIEFSKIAWGDPDGFQGTSANEGWLILDPDGIIRIDQSIAPGQQLSLDIATLDAPALPFLFVQLPEIDIAIDFPETTRVSLANSAGAVSGTIASIHLRDLTITQGTPDTMYIFTHF